MPAVKNKNMSFQNLLITSQRLSAKISPIIHFSNKYYLKHE